VEAWYVLRSTKLDCRVDMAASYGWSRDVTTDVVYLVKLEKVSSLGLESRGMGRTDNSAGACVRVCV
jgi:hypothetical protein